MENEAWRPENLEKSEKNMASRSIDDVETRSDFGSYKLMLHTGDFEKSKINSHNATKPSYRTNLIKKILGDSFAPKRIIDIGCGLGFNTFELKKIYPDAEVLGVDLSSDAIKYASKSFTCCTFKKLLINPKDDNLEKNNDLICVFEFYPFTRTSSIDEHKKYMLHLLRSMSVNGKLVIYQRWDNPASLSVNYDVIKKEIKGYEFSD